MEHLKPRERVIRVLLRILAHPYRFTRKELAKHFGVSADTIDLDIEAIKSAGLHFDQETGRYYRCAILPDPAFGELQYLQSLTEIERARIGSLMNQYLPAREALYLKNKLDSLYDFQQLGIRSLRRPALEKLDRLEKARREKYQVVLENYRSRRSNQITHRIVEPFHIDPELNTLQAFDVKKQTSLHFLMPRIERVQLTDQNWAYESHHELRPTDVFRIANPRQKMVHLRLDVYAYNDLIENYPQAKSYVESGAEPHTFDFQCRVNEDFLGLSNFIMGNAEHVEILQPEALKESIREEARKILEKF